MVKPFPKCKAATIHVDLKNIKSKHVYTQIIVTSISFQLANKLQSIKQKQGVYFRDH